MLDAAQAALTWNEYCHRLDGSWCEPARAYERGSAQYFFEANQEKRWLEVWCLKLAGMYQVCVSLAEEHEQVRRARGAIGPEQVVVQVPEHCASTLPILWSTAVSLTTRESEQPPVSESMPVDMAFSMTVPPMNTNFFYAAPQVRDWPMGKTVSATALVQSVDPSPQDDPDRMKGLIRAHLIVDGLRAEEFSDRDVFRVPLPLGENRGAHVDLWTRKVESPERGIIVAGQTAPMSLDEWSMLTRAVGAVRSSVDIAVYRAASPADDVYSCGMLLLHALFGADEQRWTQVCEQLPVIVGGLQPVVQGLDEDDHHAVHVRIKDRVRESADCFDTNGHIPEALWWDAVVAVLRACSNIRGFSYVSDMVTYDPSPVRRLALELESLTRRARIELFEAGERDAMIVRACDRAMDHLVAGVS